MDFLKEIVKEIGDDFTKVAQDIDETERFIDTGSHIFNAVVSGSIYGGVSSNKITAIAGESSTGKTYFSLAVVKNFLDNTLMVTVFILTPRLLSTKDYLSLVGLT